MSKVVSKDFEDNFEHLFKAFPCKPFTKRSIQLHPFFIVFIKIWPKLGHKRERILHFTHFESFAKSFRARNRTWTCTSFDTRTWNVRVYQFRHPGFLLFCLFQVCPGQDLNLHRLWRLPPQSSVSTNSTTWANSLFFLSKAGAKLRTFSNVAKLFFKKKRSRFLFCCKSIAICL